MSKTIRKYIGYLWLFHLNDYGAIISIHPARFVNFSSHVIQYMYLRRWRDATREILTKPDITSRITPRESVHEEDADGISNASYFHKHVSIYMSPRGYL